VNTELQASGDKDKPSQLATYEAIAFGEVGIIMYIVSSRYYLLPFLTGRLIPSECLTDNSNRTIHKLREMLNTHK
jgi:transcriptional/translational regulatory protein YebC/TACO1